MDVQQVLEGLRREDNRVVTHLFVILQPRLISYLRREKQHLEDNEAIEVLCDFMVSFIKRLQRKPLTLDSASLESYCLRACWYIWRNRNKLPTNTTNPPELLDDIPDSNDFIEDIIRAESEAEFHKKFSKLPDKCQQVLKERFVNNRTWNEIAAIFGISNNYIRNKGKSCREHLRRLLDE